MLQQNKEYKPIIYIRNNRMNIEVSVVTPTYNRRQFIPILIEIYKNQTFPKDKMEWIIVDDGRDRVEDLFVEASKTIPNIRYIFKDEKMRIGAKRNLLNKEARGDIIVAMDDDDYYPVNRVESVVKAFKKNPKIDLAGSSEMNLFYLDSKKIYTLGPFSNTHATNGTMAWRKRYSDKHKYDEFVTKAEEITFLENFKHPMIQLNPLSTILVICHTDNTADKGELRDEHLSRVGSMQSKFKESVYKLEDLLKDKKIRDFYLSL
jgi:glycosyltransferase involved in cell wall biosynthesis